MGKETLKGTDRALERELKRLSDKELSYVVDHRLYFFGVEKGDGVLYCPHGATQLAFLKSNAMVQLLQGGNSSGKSWISRQKVSIKACMKKDPITGEKIKQPSKSRIIYPTQDYIIQFGIPQLKEWIPKDMLFKSRWDASFSKMHKILSLTNGSTIDLRTFEQDIRGFEGATLDNVWADEELPEPIYKATLARLVRTGGHLWIAVTTLSKSTWMLREIRDKADSDDDIECFKMSIHDNPYLNKEDVKKLLSKFSPEERDAREKGEFLFLAGMVYGNFSRQAHTIEPFEIPPGWTRYMGCDPHDAQPFHFAWFAVSPEGVVYLYDALKVGNKSIPKLASILKLTEGNTKMYIRRIDPITGNKTSSTGGGKSIKQEFMNEGIFFQNGKKDKTAGIIKTREYLEYDTNRPVSNENTPKFLVFSNLYEVIRDMEQYNYGEIDEKKKWHYADIIRYVLSGDPTYRNVELMNSTRPKRLERASI